MNLNTVFIRAAIATAMVGVGAASFDVPRAIAQDSLENHAPLAATLLPTITVTGSAAQADAEATMTFGRDAALSVTLMPTVHVRATLAHSIARASTVIAERGEGVAGLLPTLAPIEVDSASAPLVLRVRAMPR